MNHHLVDLVKNYSGRLLTERSVDFSFNVSLVKIKAIWRKWHKTNQKGVIFLNPLISS